MTVLLFEDMEKTCTPLLHGLQYQEKLHSAALPTLDVNEGALDTIFSVYKQLLPEMGGYLVEAGRLQHRRLELLTRHLATLEQETLEQRAKVITDSPSPATVQFSVTFVTASGRVRQNMQKRYGWVKIVAIPSDPQLLGMKGS